MSTFPYNPLHDPREFFHQITTEANIGQGIQHNGGKALLINGDVFYSPNSSRTVGLPPPVKNNPKIWRNSKTSSSREFHQPLWWSEETAYLAFLPIYPQFCGEPFGELLHVPNYFDREKQGYILDPQILLKWKKLEFFLRRVSELLLVPSNAPAPKAIIDTALSCTGYYKAARYFRRAVKQTRDWFSVWMAQVSYTIALTMSSNHLPSNPNDIPEWCHFLLRREFEIAGWDQVYIFGVRQSMGTFSASVLRSGIFLQVVSPPQHQFSVDWFQRFSVPVWYPWGTKEIEAATTLPRVRRLAPPSEQLQAIATFFSKEPENLVGSNEALNQGASDKPWIAFLAERAARTKQSIANESPEARQARENRERNPPTRRAKVFIWEKDIDTENGYHRELVSQRHNEAILGGFSDSQKVYNAVFNEWDCCDELGDDKPESDDGLGDYDDFPNADNMTAHFDHEGLITPSTHISSFASSSSTSQSTPNAISVGVSGGHASLSSQHQARPMAPSPYVSTSMSSSPTSANTLNVVSSGFSSGSSSSNQHRGPTSSYADTDYDVVYYNALELLQDFLGFVPPLPLPSRSSSSEQLPKDKQQILIGLVGLREQRDDCPSMMLSKDIGDFIDAFNKSNAQIARTPIWDLAPGNRQYLGGCARLQQVKLLEGEMINDKAPETLYVFNFGQDATVPWLLAVTNVIDVLFVCRLDSRMNDYQIASHLLTRGIRFRTLAWDTLPPPRDLPFTLTPCRLSGYKFTLRDYDSYIREREALIRNPRIARAALMKGGIVWRLVVGSASASDVLSGPSAAISLHNYGLALGKSRNGCHLWDDIISNEELDQICGTYICYTGYGNQRSLKSWWPTFTLWEANVHTTYWTDFMEKKYQERLAEIATGEAQLRTSQEWRSWIRGSSHSRRIMENIETASDRFLHNIISVDPTTRQD